MSEIRDRLIKMLDELPASVMGSPIYDVQYGKIIDAILHTIREPTPAMLAAGNAVFHNGTTVSALSVWQAMCAEMLRC